MMSNYEKMDKMWDEGFLNSLPECISQHIADELEERWELREGHYLDWIENGELWDDYGVLESGGPIDGSGDAGSEYRYTPHLWSWFLFWKKIKNSKKIKENYLLGEIMWFLIQYPCVDESLYQQIFHKKEKGRKVTTFNEAKQQLQWSHKGKCWVKLAQKTHGSIIDITHEGIVLSNSWREVLECN